MNPYVYITHLQQFQHMDYLTSSITHGHSYFIYNTLHTSPLTLVHTLNYFEVNPKHLILSVNTVLLYVSLKNKALKKKHRVVPWWPSGY